MSDNHSYGWQTIPEFAENVPKTFSCREKDAGDQSGRDRIQNLHVLCRTLYTAGESIASCRLLISADDYFKLYVNGTYVGQGPAPGSPDCYYAQVYDLAGYLHSGVNVIAVHAYYQGLRNRVWNSADGRFALMGKIVGVGDAQSEDVDLSWEYQICRAYSGDVTGYETQFLENFDSRLWDAGWNRLQDAGQGKWQPMVRAQWADYHLVRQPSAPLQIDRRRPAVMRRKSDGSWFLDAGSEIAGSLRLKARGRSGQKIRVLCGEELEETGAVKSRMRCNCTYEETWTLADGICELEPYDYKGFRYAQLIPDEGAEILDACFETRHYPMEEKLCTLKTSDPVLDDIFRICKNAVKYGTQEGYLDCPAREKGQYLGDAVVTARSQVWLSGSTDMLRKCIDQFARTLDACPGMRAIGPCSVMQEVADYSLLWTELLLTEYEFSGDRAFLASCYPAVQKTLSYFRSYERDDGLLENVNEKWNMVDWPENLRDGYDFPLTIPVGRGCHNVINAQYIGALKRKAQIEKILGLPENTDWEKKREQYQKVFFRPESGLFADSENSGHSSLHSNVYALYFGLVPEEARQSVCRFLIRKGFSCGVMTSYFMMKALAGAGEYEAVYRLLMNDGEHGWRNMLRDGATACMEAWGKDQKWNTSFCHPWASAPVSILIEEIGGIVLSPETETGFQWRPHIPEQLRSFHLQVPLRDRLIQVAREQSDHPDEQQPGARLAVTGRDR